MIYIIRTSNFVKIGYSTDVNRRFKELQAANPLLLELVGSFPGTLSLERTIHAKLRPHRCGGGSEWYQMTSNVTEFVNNFRTNGLLRLLES